jgi:hypothetical protein
MRVTNLFSTLISRAMDSRLRGNDVSNIADRKTVILAKARTHSMLP